MSTTHFENELRCAVDGGRSIGEIDTALETEAGIGDESQTPRLALNNGGIPECAFEEHGARRIVDAAMLPAHDSSESQRFFLVRDEKQVRIE